jgi:uncharacterized protein (TIGR00369 family)
VIIDEPVRGKFAYLENPWLFGLPPVDQLRPFMERLVPLPPIHHLTGLVPVEAGPGTATWAMPASPWWQSAAGPFPGGALAVVGDAALGGAIHTNLSRGMVLATSELSMNFLRPATVDSGTLMARSRIVQAGTRQGLSEARIEDAAGRLLSHATSRLVIRPLPFDPPEPPDPLPPPQTEEFPTVDPYLRPPEGEVLPQEMWDETGGLDLVRMWLKEELAAPPVCQLVGWRIEDADEGSATWSMPASQWFCTGYGTFYGGAIALFIDIGMDIAVTTTIPPGTSFGTLDLKINFLRPVVADGRDLTGRATVVHRGQTIAVTTAEVDDADGKRVVVATASAMILPGRPWSPAKPVATVDEAPAEENA